jgi:hypothetical protein
MARAITKAPAKRSLPGKTCRLRTRLTQRPTPPRPLLPATTTTRVLRSQTKATAQRPSEATDRGVTKIKSRRRRLDPWTPKRKPKKDSKPRASPAIHFTCRICVSSLPRDSFIRWVPLKRWHGKPLDAPLPCIRHLAPSPYRRIIDPVCKTCIGSTMAARLDMLGARRVGSGCVEPGCSEEWPWEMILKYFPSSKLEAFNLASFEHWRTDTDLFNCLASDCSFTGLLDPNAPGYPQVECPVSTCRARSCATCLTPWHVDQTCAEVKSAALIAQMSNPEKETLALMQSKDGKRCPNCQLVVEKDGGCSSMFCSGTFTVRRYKQRVLLLLFFVL